MLYTTAKYLQCLGVQMDPERRLRLRALQMENKIQISHIYTDRKGRKRIKGGRHLKSTEHYPYGLGLKVVELYEANAS